ncbi:MAG TPA: class I SAM-dependent methyltransferase [Azospirillaceae bacterium]|nr:class I SAM-dependent methyltransferase [Azospirillaceae bacterium]
MTGTTARLAKDPATRPGGSGTWAFPTPDARDLAARVALARRLATGAQQVVDVGCGSGHLLLALSDVIGHGVGIDISGEALDEAERAVDARGVGNIRFLEGDALDAARHAEPPGLIDLAILAGVLEHVDDPADLLSAWGRRIGPWGRILVVSPHRWSPGGSYARRATRRTDDRAVAARLKTPMAVARMARGCGLVVRGVWSLPWVPPAQAEMRLPPWAERAARTLARVPLPALSGAYGMVLVQDGKPMAPLRSMPSQGMDLPG